MTDFHAIIPAGGAGTRLWPLSREAEPKFLLDPAESGRSLLQQTWDRIEPLTGPSNIHIVSGAAHAAAIHDQLPELQHLIVEPQARDSMPAIALAALLIERNSPGAVVGTFAADHVIDDPENFRVSVQQGISVARAGFLCAIGIPPDHASSAFGYIQAGAAIGIETAPHARHVTRFVEKPDPSTAESFLASGDWTWNAGIYLGEATTILKQLTDYEPGLDDGVRRYVDGDDSWSTLPSVSIDKAIAEPAAANGKLATIPAGFGWSDLGDFTALAELSSGSNEEVLWVDAYGTAVRGAHSGGRARAISVLGIPDVLIVDTGDNLLITTRAYAQRVNELPELWRDRGRSDLI